MCVECDHKALKPLFQKQLKGAIYERWLAILQQFDIEIKYKLASEMCVADALSRNPIFPSRLDSSPEEEDPYFPFVEEKVQPVKLPNGKNLESLFDHPVESNFIKTINVEYDADTEDDWQKPHAPLRKRGRPIKALPSQNSKVIKEDEISPAIINDSDPFDKTTEINSDQSDYQRNTVVDSCESDHPEQALTTTESVRASIPTLTHQTSLATADVIQKQHSDPDLADLIKYLENGTLPDSQKSARDILLQHSNYALIDGMLFHSRIAKSKRAKTQTVYQLVVPQDMIIDILHRYHDSPLAAHGGIQNTLDKIKKHYFFPKMSQIISNYVKSCQYCQKRKFSRASTKSSITTYPTPAEPFEVWEIDLYGPLPLSKQGSSNSFTAIDMFSKYVVAYHIKSKDAVTQAQAFFKLITNFGVCNTIISDQGSECIAKVTSELCKMLHVAQQFTPAFMHHCLGACERVLATLAERLTPYMTNDMSNWEECLSSIVFSINCSVNTSLGYSPYEIVFLRRQKFPLVNYHSEPTTSPKDLTVFLSNKLWEMNIIRTEILDNAQKAKDTMVENANSTLRPLTLQKHDYVFLHNENVHKLQNQYSGPFVVHKIPSAQFF